MITNHSTYSSTSTVIVFLVSLLFGTLVLSTETFATPVVGFNAGKIIEDSVFTNTNSMNAGDIQIFLNSKVPTCDTWGTQTSEFGGGTRAQWGAANGKPAPYICLKDYTENGKSAAQIILEAAQEFQINPQVFIVLLQKEQGLVTDTWPLPGQYRTATGYGCPDTAECDSQYFGLTNQIRWSGRMFRAILNNSPTWYTPYILGNNFIRWSPNSACGGSTVNIQNRSTQALYNYTPYQPNQSALNAGYGMGDSCGAYGNRNFYLYFKDWFGYNSGPPAFKTSGSSTIYVAMGGYKLTVPYMAAMQDYGISTEAIQTVSQSYVDSIPLPPSDSGISHNISHVIKSPYDTDEDGGSVYLISRGKRYQIQTMQQFYNYGFTEADISYLPLSYIFAKSNGGMASDFIASPYGNIFKLSSIGKQMYFEYTTYMSQNPSDQLTLLSYYLADKIPSSTPISNRPVLVKYSDSESVHLYINNNYYSIPDFNTFLCWGLQGTYGLPVYRVSQNNYIAPINHMADLNCSTNDGQSMQVLNNDIRQTIPSSYELSTVSINSDLKTFQERLPLRNTPLKEYVKTDNAAAIWYIESGKVRLIPSYRSFVLLGLTSNNIDIISQSVLNRIPRNGIKLADGQLVKDPTSALVYIISGNQRVAYTSGNLFTSYGNDWNDIETFPGTQLDQFYPFQNQVIGDILVDKDQSKSYIVASNGCYRLSDESYAAYGLTYDALVTNQTYESNIFKKINLTNCAAAPDFIKQNGESLVYWMNDGKKHALTTYDAMLSKNNGKPPVVMNVTPSFISQFPSGQSY